MVSKRARRRLGDLAYVVSCRACVWIGALVVIAVNGPLDTWWFSPALTVMSVLVLTWAVEHRNRKHAREDREAERAERLRRLGGP